MRILLPAMLAAMTLLFTAGPAGAQDARTLYVSGFGAWNFLMDADIEVGGASAGDAEFSQGFALGGAVGFRFVDDFRAEIEGSYRQNDLDLVFTANADGDATSLALMANGYYDFPDIGGALRSPLRPYLGGGIGVARVAWNDVTVGATSIVDDDEFIIAYQAMAGLGFGVTDAVTLTVDYRFFATPSVELERAGGSNALEADNLNHMVSAGLRVEF